MNELGAKFLRLEESCLWLEEPDARICILLLGPPPGQARWADCREEVARQLETALVERHQADGELEALRTSTTLVQNLVLGKAGRPSSLAMSLSMAEEKVENRINTATANGV
jgi:hypothetical protein